MDLELTELKTRIEYLEKNILECKTVLKIYETLIKEITNIIGNIPNNKEQLSKFIEDIIVERENRYFQSNTIPNELKELIQAGILLTGPAGKEGARGKEGIEGKMGKTGL
jgi:hypothetical protein